MAAKQPKSDVYRTLFRLNRAFDFVTEQLPLLAKAGVLTTKYVRMYESFTKELQADINGQALGDLQTLEENDWAEFGKVRSKLEKEAKKVPGK